MSNVVAVCADGRILTGLNWGAKSMVYEDAETGADRHFESVGVSHNESTLLDGERKPWFDERLAENHGTIVYLERMAPP